MIYATEIHWQDATNQPNHNGPVWGWCPDIGNDEEGYGMVLVVRCTLEPLFVRDKIWVDASGLKVRVTKWAWLHPPEPPESE